MVEFLLHFEQMAGRFPPLFLIAPGVAMVLLGLFLWLGGLGLAKVVAALAGIIAGGIVGFIVSGNNLGWAIASALASAIVDILLRKIFGAALAAAIVALMVFAVVAWPDLQNAQSLKSYPSPKEDAGNYTLSKAQTMEILKAYATDLGGAVKQSCSQTSKMIWAAVAAAAVVSLIVGLSLWQLASAFCYATLGVTLIFVGMVSLLLYKGSGPVSDICNRGMFYLGVLGAMIAFGTIEQLLLLRRSKAGLAGKAGEEKGRKSAADAPRRHLGWRSS